MGASASYVACLKRGNLYTSQAGEVRKSKRRSVDGARIRLVGVTWGSRKQRCHRFLWSSWKKDRKPMHASQETLGDVV